MRSTVNAQQTATDRRLSRETSINHVLYKQLPTKRLGTSDKRGTYYRQNTQRQTQLRLPVLPLSESVRRFQAASQHKLWVRHIATDELAWSVGRSVCLCVTTASPAENG